MDRNQISLLKSLDSEGTDGTIQSVLLSENLSTKPFEAVAMHLLKRLKAEKDFLMQNNIALSRELNKEKS